MATLRAGPSMVPDSGGRGPVARPLPEEPLPSPPAAIRTFSSPTALAFFLPWPRGRESGAGRHARRKQGFMSPLKSPCASHIAFPPSPSPPSGVKTLKNLPEAPPKHVQGRRPAGPGGRGLLGRPRRDRDQDLDPDLAPAPARISADPSCSLPAGARAGLGCALLRAFFPGISTGSHRSCAVKPRGPQSNPSPLRAAGGEQHAGRGLAAAARTGRSSAHNRSGPKTALSGRFSRPARPL